MSANQLALWYLVAAVSFILALKGLSSPQSSRRGNLYGMIGMAIAVLFTLAVIYFQRGSVLPILAGIAVGGTVATMKPGAVIVDLAVEQGGNVDGSELDKIVMKDGVKIIGLANLPAFVAADASALYARNVLNFLALSLNTKTGEFNVPKDDEIIKATLVCENGQVVPRS